MHIHLLRLLAHLLCEAGKFLAVLLRRHNLREHHIADFGVLMHEVVKFLLYEVTDELLHAHASRVGCYCGRSKTHLGLALEHRFLYIDCDCSHNTVADIAILEVLCREKIMYCLRHKLLERTLVRTALRCMLSVDKGVVLLAILLCMGKGNLDIRSAKMDNRIESLSCHIVGQEVGKTVTRKYALAVEHDCKAGIQVSVVA